MTSSLSQVSEMPRLTHGTDHKAVLHTPYEQTKVARAVTELLGVHTHIVQSGETLAQLAKALGVLQPMSLFRVVEGQQWQVQDGFMKNLQSGTSFPVQSAANDKKFVFAA